MFFFAPCCCCVRSHPDSVCVPFDLVTEHVYSRPLAVVTFASFTWQAFLAYFVVLTGTDPTEFTLCGLNTTLEDNTAAAAIWGATFATVGVLQSGVLAIFFAVPIGLGNSKWQPRCWGFVSPCIALLSYAAMIPAMQHCTEVLQQEGEDAGFTLFAGATSNYVSTGFYSVQLWLSLMLLLRRRKRTSACGTGDGDFCGAAQYNERLPIRPLHPRSP